jgi:uncharacterized repeat protein (TIGR01451 family)
MKKALLLIVFLLSVTTYGQMPPGLLDPYNICDDMTNDGVAVFDLAATNPIGMLGLDPASYTVTFHPTVGEANDNTNTITNPSAYSNEVPYYQIIGIRILNTLTSEVNTTGMELFVNAMSMPTFTSSMTVCSGDNLPPLPTTSLEGYTGTWSPPLMANVTTMYTFTPYPNQCATNAYITVVVAPPAIAYQGSLSFCDLQAAPIYDLTTANTQITGGNLNNTVNYFLTLADAQSNSNALNNSFIPTVIPGNQILYARVTNFSGCSAITTLTLHTQNCNTGCVPPTQITTSSLTATSTTVSWTENGMAMVWHILLLPAGSPAPTAQSTGWVVASVNPFTMTGLNPSTAYDVYVRAVCSNTTYSDWSTAATFVTLSYTGCGGTFSDQGGSTGNYPNNANYTTTICPSNPGDAVSVTFVSFNTEVFADALYVYDGTSIAAPMIPSMNAAPNLPGSQPGGYWGNTIPGPFTASNVTGCLTFKFSSDGTNTLEGWLANVDCIPQLCNTPTNLAVSNLTDTTVSLSWDTISNAAGYEVLLLPTAAPEPTPNDAGFFASVNPFVLTGLSPYQCYKVYLRTICAGYSEWSSPINFCMVNCQNNAQCTESLVLNAFLDSNNNGVKDSGEINFPYGSFVYQINDSGNNLYGYANNDSYYIFDANPTNSYDINFTINSSLNGYYASTVSHNNITLPAGSGANTLYFPVTITQPHIDAQCYIYANGQPVPGFSNVITLYYSNYGTQPIANGTLTYTKDPNTTISSISQAGTIATSNGFTYNFTNLAPFESRYIYVVVTIPPIPTVNLGQLVTHSVTIDCANDVDLSNNNASITQVVVGSYDPNEKSESHGGKIGLDHFNNNDYLYYTVQFENTGTANAQFIRVEDQLDAGLDESTFEMISASYTVNTKREGNQLTWHFYNINLPPTVNNPTSSHGYVLFKIKPKTGYAVGDVIPNKAAIYFDYNPAIITNTCNTEFFQTLGNPSFTANTITLYPNPASNAVQITNSLNETITNVALYEVSGKLVKQLSETNQSQITVDLQNLAKGLYFVEITTASNTKQIKKLIIQ